MKADIKSSMFLGVFVAAIGWTAGPVFAEKEVSVTIEKITIEDMVYTPYYRVDTEQDHQQGSAARWIRLGVYFKTDGGWIDEMEITQMALKPNKELGRTVVLSDTTTYVNIESGDHYVYVYMHPSYVKRYRISDFDLDSAAIIKVNGKVVATRESAKYGKDGWSSAEDQTVFHGYLLNHAETPFWFINYDFKEMIRR